MNYRHIFHAGNICDVAKHSVLSLLLGRLIEKEKPLCFLDTHAGIGLYDLLDPRALKTGEAQLGVAKFFEAPRIPELQPYYDAVESFNKPDEIGKKSVKAGPRFYPGSPFLAEKLLRKDDRIIACELHDEDAKLLRFQAHYFENMHVHHRDGYDGLRAFLPPAEKRGLAIIDPPYEEPDEFERLIDAVKSASKIWANGLLMVWYPIKERPAVWRLHEALIATGIPRQLSAEFIYEPETRHDRLNGCGFILVNPPWKFDVQLRKVLPEVHKALGTSHQGVDVRWLTSESTDGLTATV